MCIHKNQHGYVVTEEHSLYPKAVFCTLRDAVAFIQQQNLQPIHALEELAYA